MNVVKQNYSAPKAHTWESETKTKQSTNSYDIITYSKPLQKLFLISLACVAGDFGHAVLKVLAAKPREEWGGSGYFSRGLAAKTFDPARTKPPATQAIISPVVSFNNKVHFTDLFLF